MISVNIHEAKTQLSKLVDGAAAGESFIIAKAGKPLVRVSAIDAPAQHRRIGFLAGDLGIADNIPDDFDEIAREEIEHMFYDEP